MRYAIPIPRRILGAYFMVIVLIAAGTSSPRIIPKYRYAEWSTINRSFSENVLPTLVVTGILSAVMARRAMPLAAPWFAPSLKRGRIALAATSGVIAITDALAYLVGWIPVLAWGFATGTYSGPDLLDITATLAWVAATALISLLVTLATSSLWPALILALCWAIPFELGRSWNEAFIEPPARFSALPFDGVFIDLTSDQHLTSALCLLRLSGAAIVIAGSLWGLRAIIGSGGRGAHLKRALIPGPIIAVVCLIAIAETTNVHIRTTISEPQICQNKGDKTCVLAAHTHDLSTAHRLVTNLHGAIPALFSPVVAAEGKEVSPQQSAFTIYTEKSNNPELDVSQALANSVMFGSRCSTVPSSETQTLTAWFTYLALNGNKPNAHAGTSNARVNEWAKAPSSINEVLTKNAEKVHNCMMSPGDLP